MALSLPDVGAFTDADRNAAVAKIAAMDATFTGKIDWSAFSPPSGGSANGTMISSGGVWTSFTGTSGVAAVKFLCENAAATGGFATLRVRARSAVATPVWNQYTMAIDAAASAVIADYGELYGGSFFAQDNGYAQSRPSHWSVGLKAAIGCTGTSSGLRMALLVTSTSTSKSSLQDYLIRCEKSSGGIGFTIDGVFDFCNCGDFTYWANFETVGGYLDDTETTHSSMHGSIRVHTPGGVKYIRLCT